MVETSNTSCSCWFKRQTMSTSASTDVPWRHCAVGCVGPVHSYGPARKEEETWGVRDGNQGRWEAACWAVRAVVMGAVPVPARLEEPNVLHEALHPASDVVVRQHVGHVELPGRHHSPGLHRLDRRLHAGCRRRPRGADGCATLTGSRTPGSGSVLP